MIKFELFVSGETKLPREIIEKIKKINGIKKAYFTKLIGEVK